MNKIAHYLQEHISGEVITSSDVRRHFSTDASIFKLVPSVVVYPRNENDVRKIARFTWQLAGRGRVFPITARGAGTDQTGAAIGNGIVLVFPAHFNRILELDSKTGIVTVEAGINYGKLQQALITHDRYLPPYPASIEYSTIGGAIANNAGGDKSVKYGSTREYIKSLRVVLANGEVIETKRLNKRELNKKLGLSTFEGEIYRSVDILIEENQKLIDKLNIPTTKNSSGYGLNYVKQKNGSFDLTHLFIGSQGTLGLVTEATLTTEKRHSSSTLIAALVDDLNVLGEIILELRKLPEMPSSIEVVDDNLLKLVQKLDPNLIKNIIPEPFPKFVLLIEFDNASDQIQKRLSKRVIKFLKTNEVSYQIETESARKEELWKIRHSTVSVLIHNDGNAKALPVIEDGIVPPENLIQYMNSLYDLFERNRLPIAIYGHAGDGNLHLQPLLNLNQVGDRQTIFRLMEDYYRLVIELGGSISGENGDGRLRAPFLEQQLGTELYNLSNKVKQIFDPHGTLNPGIKFGVNLEDLKPMLRDEYTLGHLYGHLPYV